ncbi:MAG TPA: methyltransferase domain-containing protein, partial [Bryobacteraceae bacterium]|nr:methyltransferase domain-containing protein [Bryobacteraceae bacterium]
MTAAAFDSLAAVYDDLWTNSTIGQLQRAAFWRHAGPLFRPGETVLDLGCGTGEDAALLRDRGIRTLAIDSSPEMVRVACERGIDARLL